ncbi:MAG: HK97-fold major capsid protein [Candidatus Odinarchaeia archaeon]
MSKQKIDEAKRIELFKKIFYDDVARKAWAASLSIPVKKDLEHKGSVRKIFASDPLEPGALASYPVDFDNVTAWVMPRMGAIPINYREGDEVLVNTFEVVSDVSFRMTYARDGRFNISQRARKKLSDAILVQEEETGWTLIKAAVLPANTITIAGAEGEYMSKKLINEMIACMEDYEGFKADIMFCSILSAAEIREWDNSKLDDQTRREVWQRGGLGSMWGVDIIPLNSLGDDEVYLFDTSRFGVMPERQKLMTFEDPTASNRLRISIMAYEEIGFGVLDDRAVVKGVINRA